MEDLPQEQPAQPQVAPETQLVNVYDPDTQEVGSIPAHQLNDALSQGYQRASDQQAQKFINQQKFSTLPQKALTALEGVGEGVAGPVFTAAEKAFGAEDENILGRREENPTTHMVGQGLGLAGSLATGVGEGALLEKAGVAGAEALGLGAVEGANAVQKIGSAGVKTAIETGLLQSGDEVSKMIMSDPNQTAETAVTNIGLAALLGGGTGAGFASANPLWNATVGPKVGSLLEAISTRGGGVKTTAEEALQKAMDTSGLNIAPEVKASIQGEPWMKQMGETLKQSDTNTSGLEFQQTISKLRNDANEGILSSLGKTEKDIIPSDQFSNFEVGKKIGTTLAKEFESKTNPIAEKFEKIKTKYADLELPQDQEVITPSGNPYLSTETTTVEPGLTSTVADKIGQLVQKEGWYSSPSSDIMGEVRRVLKELPQQKTLKDLSNYITQVGANTYDFTNPQLTRAGSLIKGILKDAEADVVVKKLSADAPELVAEHADARTAWKAASDLKESLNDRLHVGGGDSIGSFVKNLKSMSAEDAEKVVRRLSGKGDAALLNILKEKFPQTAELVKNYHVDQLLSTAAGKAKEGQTLNASTLFDRLKKMSPELRDFSIAPESQQKLQAIDQILTGLESKTYNFSNTARTVDKLLNYMPGSALGMATLLTGHNPLLALAVGGLTKMLGRDIPDAIRLSLLKFLGSSQPIEAEGFKSMVDFIQHTIKGENLVSKASKNIFHAGEVVLPSHFIPSEKDTDKLDKRLQKLQTNQEAMLNIGGKTGHYLPDHGMAMGQTAANAVNYLNGLRPNVDKKAPLDQKPQPTKIEKASFKNALTIAQQPLVVLERVKDGTVTAQDLVHLHTLYPALYNRLSQKMMEQMTNALTKELIIPYKTRMGLSLFMAQPLDSTMTPAAIQANQKSLMGAQIQKAMEQPQMRPKHSMNALNKIGTSNQTASQSRESQRIFK